MAGHPLALLVIHNDLKPGQWTGYSAQPADYTAYINPEVQEPDSLELEDDYEECPVLPKYAPHSVKALVSRFSTITVDYMTEADEKKSETVTGFRARVLQHEIDHFYGLSLLNFSVSDGNVELISPREQSKLLDTNREYMLRYKSALKVAEERYLCDAAFKQKIDNKVNGRGIKDVHESLQDYALDADFENEMTAALEAALKEDELRELEEEQARPRKKHK